MRLWWLVKKESMGDNPRLKGTPASPRKGTHIPLPPCMCSNTFKYNDCSQLLHSVADKVLRQSLQPPARGIIYLGPEDLPRPQKEIAEDGSLRTSCRLSQCLAPSPCHQTDNERVIRQHTQIDGYTIHIQILNTSRHQGLVRKI